MRVYLAGPDVFRADCLAHGAALKAICAARGVEGVHPLDHLPDEPADWGRLAEARRIALRNEAQIRRCQALIANLTPFRGVSADPGTVFELGYARALGLPVFGWSATPLGFTERTLAALGATATRDAEGTWRDAEGMAVEAFGCADNLMLDGAIHASGGALVLGSVAEAGAAGGLAAFRRCLEALVERLTAPEYVTMP